MPDQATELRKLMLRSARESALPLEPPPRLVVLTGGCEGVGVSTLAVQLAVALAELGSRVVLVDANQQRNDLALLCGLPELRNSPQLPSLRTDIHEVLVRGPSGVLVVPGLWAAGRGEACTESAQLRFIKQFRQLGRHADIVLLDTGSATNEIMRRFWQAASDVVMVTTPSDQAVMDAYATIKTLLGETAQGSVQLIVNRATTQDSATDVHRRIDQSCRRFLGIQIESLGAVPNGAEQRPAVSQIAMSLLTETFIATNGLAFPRKAA